MGQYSIAPVLDFNRDTTLDTPYDFGKKNASPSIPKILVDPNYNPFEKETKNFSSSYIVKKDNNSWESLYLATDILETQGELFQEQANVASNKTFQIQKKYLLSSIKSGMVLIHQSLAHQRVLYEDFLNKVEQSKVNSQQLLFPITISFSSREIETVYTLKSDLESIGFDFDEFTKESLTIKGMPTSIIESKVTHILEELLENVNLDVPEAEYHPYDMIAKSLAKLGENKTTIVVAHKLSTVENADVIFVMDKGLLVEFGTHSNLMQNKKHYAAMVKAQKTNTN